MSDHRKYTTHRNMAEEIIDNVKLSNFTFRQKCNEAIRLLDESLNSLSSGYMDEAIDQGNQSFDIMRQYKDSYKGNPKIAVRDQHNETTGLYDVIIYDIYQDDLMSQYDKNMRQEEDQLKNKIDKLFPILGSIFNKRFDEVYQIFSDNEIRIMGGTDEDVVRIKEKEKEEEEKYKTLCAIPLNQRIGMCRMYK